jgi:metallo-beta-lactamase family protein
MIDFLNPLNKSRIKKLFLVHGDYDVQQVFSAKLKESGFQNIEIPEQGNVFNLEI